MKNNLKKMRQGKKLSLADFSKLTGLSASYLCHLENGIRENPSLSTLKKICNALGYSIYSIFPDF